MAKLRTNLAGFTKLQTNYFPKQKNMAPCQKEPILF